MEDETYVELLKKGYKIWNEWKENNHSTLNLKFADLRSANLDRFDFHAADLYGANLSLADLGKADFSRADLRASDLRGAVLRNTDLRGADLRGADLRGAYLRQTNLTGAQLRGSDLTKAYLLQSTVSDVDLSDVKGLETVIHLGPSSIGVETLLKSNGQIPEVFLKGVGLPDDFITFVPSLTSRAIEFYSCFISYSHQDEAFSKQLDYRLRASNLRVWYAPADLKGGRKLHEEIFRAIQIHDKLLLVLSDNSMKSEWVMTEIRNARRVERNENRRKLFPIRLVSFDAIRKWECFDADSGKDLATEVREYYIPDFSDWKDHDSFEKEFAKLLRDLKANEV